MLFIFGLKTSNNLQQLSIEMIQTIFYRDVKNLKENKSEI